MHRLTALVTLAVALETPITPASEARSSESVPILMYHPLDDPGSGTPRPLCSSATGRACSTSPSRKSSRRAICVSALRRLLRAGWEIDSHTLTHRDLTRLGDAELRTEVTSSRRILRRLLDRPVDFFCYPAGQHDGRVVAAVREAGYLGATTTRDEFALPHEPFTLARIRVKRSDEIEDLARKLARLG